jgi:hypothetical protein
MKRHLRTWDNYRPPAGEHPPHAATCPCPECALDHLVGDGDGVEDEPEEEDDA